MVLERIFGSDSGTDSQLNMDDFNTQLVDKTFSLKFTRHEQKIEFIRAGDPVTIIWDEPEGTRFSSVDKVTRGDVRSSNTKRSSASKAGLSNLESSLTQISKSNTKSQRKTSLTDKQQTQPKCSSICMLISSNG